MKKVHLKIKNQKFPYRNVSIILLLMLLTLHVFAQNITLNKRNAKITDVLKEIRKKTGYNFVLNDQLINQAKPVTLDVTNVSVKNLLDELFRDQPFTYNLHNRIISIVPRNTNTTTTSSHQQEFILITTPWPVTHTDLGAPSTPVHWLRPNAAKLPCSSIVLNDELKVLRNCPN